MTAAGTLRNYALLNGQILYWLFIGSFRGKPVNVPAVLRQMVHIGVQAFPMAALTALQATTSSVVTSILAMLVANAILTAFFFMV